MAHSSSISCRTLLERQQFLQQQQQKRLARRIHDIVSQKLTLLSLQLSLAGAEFRAPEAWAQSCKNWTTSTIELGHALRDVINDLKPRVLDESGLLPALQWYATALPDNFTCRVIASAESVSLSPLLANELFSVCRDIITGLFQPAGVTDASIELEPGDETLRVHLRASDKDGGRAIALDEASLEIWAIPDRMMCLEGCAEFTFEPGAGFLITLSLPAPRPVRAQALSAA